MEMFYITRYEHNPNKTTEYYSGGGYWCDSSDVVSMRLYSDESDVKEIIINHTECDWHSVELRN